MLGDSAAKYVPMSLSGARRIGAQNVTLRLWTKCGYLPVGVFRDSSTNLQKNSKAVSDLLQAKSFNK